jgi:hypothetical protein
VEEGGSNAAPFHGEGGGEAVVGPLWQARRRAHPLGGLWAHLWSLQKVAGLSGRWEEGVVGGRAPLRMRARFRTAAGRAQPAAPLLYKVEEIEWRPLRDR